MINEEKLYYQILKFCKHPEIHYISAASLTSIFTLASMDQVYYYFHQFQQPGIDSAIVRPPVLA